MINIAVVGFGTIGGGVVEIIDKNARLIESRLGDRIEVKYIVDIRDFTSHPLSAKIVKDFKIVLSDPGVSVVAEMIGGLHPAYDYSLAAIRAGKSVVTSNKEVVAKYGASLLAEAAAHGVRYLYEASVGGGIPIIRPLSTSLSGNDIYEIDGILNGTSNYILTRMENSGLSMSEALAEAQAKGYAEADPTADISGRDACRKICILAATSFGKLIPSDSVRTKGIADITIADIKNAKASGRSVKLIARAHKKPDGGIFMEVAPFAVKASNPLSGIHGVYNGILVSGDAVGDVMFYGKGAGALPTASAVLSDIIDIASAGSRQPAQSGWEENAGLLITEPDDEIKTKTAEFIGEPI